MPCTRGQVRGQAGGERAATELAGASRELTAAADEDVAQTAAEVSRARVARRGLR